MKRSFEIDVLECPKCSGRMRFIACIMDRDSIRDILGLATLSGQFEETEEED